MLKVTDVSKRFGNVEALVDIDLTLDRGLIHGVVGPNGAGKTTLLNIISGYLLSGVGRVVLEGRDITRLTPQQRVPLGVVRTFQNIRLFGDLTVFENVLLGQHTRSQSGPRSLVPVRSARDKRLRAEAANLLDLFELTPYRKRRAAELPYAVQKQLELARALAAGPKLLLLDEPAAGMTTAGRQTLVHRIRQIRDGGLSIVVVEHDIDVISKLCDVVTVLNFGRKLATGIPKAVFDSDAVRAAYLGT